MAQLRPLLFRTELDTLFRDVEMPLCPVLAEMEAYGIGVSMQVVAELRRRVLSRLAAIGVAASSDGIASEGLDVGGEVDGAPPPETDTCDFWPPGDGGAARIAGSAASTAAETLLQRQEREVSHLSFLLNWWLADGILTPRMHQNLGHNRLHGLISFVSCTGRLVMTGAYHRTPALPHSLPC
jgi:hypothetical protein